MESKLSLINNYKIIRILSILTILYINLLLISIFAQYFFYNLSLDNPFVAKESIIKLFNPYAEFGFILSIVLPIILILKFTKQNLLVILISLSFIVAYYYKLS